MTKKKMFCIGVSLLVACFAIPFTYVSVITITVEDQRKQPINAGVEAVFIDKKGQEIVTIDLSSKSSWANNIHWWAHSYHDASLKRPKDAIAARTAVIKAKNCQSLTIPVTLSRHYESPSLSLHGGGISYFLYEFNHTVNLDCTGKQS